MDSASAPTSPTGGANPIHSSSYSSIVCDVVAKSNERPQSPSTCELSPSSPASHVKDTPKKTPTSGSKKTETSSSGGGWGLNVFKRMGLGFGQATDAKPAEEAKNDESSLFYHDNLTSLRASKQNNPEPEATDTSKAPGSGLKNNPSVVTTSTLSPDSAEFVPLIQRASGSSNGGGSLNKAVGSNNPKKDNSWASVDDSALRRPPPGLSRNSQNIWGLDSLVSGTTQMSSSTSNGGGENNDRWTKTLFEPKYSCLLDGNADAKEGTSSGFDFGNGPTTSATATGWAKSGEEKEFSVNLDKDLWGSASCTSIWDAPDALMSPAGTPGSAKRSRLRLGLDLATVDVGAAGVSDGDNSPIDPFSMWVPGVDPAAPYEGWTKDIKEE